MTAIKRFLCWIGMHSIMAHLVFENGRQTHNYCDWCGKDLQKQ